MRCVLLDVDRNDFVLYILAGTSVAGEWKLIQMNGSAVILGSRFARKNTTKYRFMFNFSNNGSKIVCKRNVGNVDLIHGNGAVAIEIRTNTRGVSGKVQLGGSRVCFPCRYNLT